MEFRVAVFFIALYYIRPQDWVPGMAGMNIIKPLIAVWIYALYVQKDREGAVPIKILQTPHDWVMLSYFLYVGLTATDPFGTLKGFLPSITFYFLTVLSLTSRDRILNYLKWWNALLVIVAAFGVLSLYGFDVTGAREMTSKQDGRLSLGTWMHNNPNALAHTTVVALAFSYVLYFWKAPFIQRMVIFPICVIISFYATYETQSKGGFLVGGFLVILVFVVGRPPLVKIIAIALATSAGVSALAFLPRMGNIDNLRNEPGVEGRLMAWHTARDVVKRVPTGEGYKEFEAWISWEGESFPIATHSSYVEIGGDLGIYGLFLFTAAIWTVFHTLFILRKSNDDGLERIRRAAILLMLAYCFSSWMVNREYHPEYFLTIAVAAAIHRQVLREKETLAADVSADQSQGIELTGPFNPEKTLWNRFGVLDLAGSVALTALVLWCWDYIYKNL